MVSHHFVCSLVRAELLCDPYPRLGLVQALRQERRLEVGDPFGEDLGIERSVLRRVYSNRISRVFFFFFGRMVPKRMRCKHGENEVSHPGVGWGGGWGGEKCHIMGVHMSRKCVRVECFAWCSCERARRSAAAAANVVSNLPLGLIASATDAICWPSWKRDWKRESRERESRERESRVGRE